MVFLDGDPRLAARSGRTPIGAKLLKERDGSPVLVEKRVLLTGKYVIDASSGLEQQSGSPAVFVTLDGKGARIFSKATGNVLESLWLLFLSSNVMGAQLKR